MTVFSETEHTAAKAHRCDECPKPIEVGQRFIRWAGLTDGDFGTYKAHTECRAAVLEFNKLYGTGLDDWVTLLDMESEDWDWLLWEHPVVAARFGRTIYDWFEPNISLAYGFPPHPFFWQTP